jgi:hypothetical protein
MLRGLRRAMRMDGSTLAPQGEVGIWLPGAGLGIRNQLAVESGTNQFQI